LFTLESMPKYVLLDYLSTLIAVLQGWYHAPLKFMFHRRSYTISYEPLTKNNAKAMAKLLQKKERYEERSFLVEGVRLCQELLASQLTVTDIVFAEKLLTNETGQGILAAAAQKKIQVWESSEEMLQKLCDTTTPQPVVACARMREIAWPAAFVNGRRWLVLSDVSDPGNVGTLLRAAEAFGWDGVLCSGNTSDLYNPKVIRAAMGSAFRLPVQQVEKQVLLSFFEGNGVTSVASTPGSGDTPPFATLPAKLALVMGNEAHGLDEAWLAHTAMRVQLPMAAHIDSLNVAVAGGILLFLLR
jgi:TrmH family RNA methyltransferase